MSKDYDKHLGINSEFLNYKNNQQLEKFLIDEKVNTIVVTGNEGTGKSTSIKRNLFKNNITFLEFDLSLSLAGNILLPFYHTLEISNNCSISEIKDSISEEKFDVIVLSNYTKFLDVDKIIGDIISYKLSINEQIKIIVEFNSMNSILYIDFFPYRQLDSYRTIHFNDIDSELLSKYTLYKINGAFNISIENIKILTKLFEGSYSECNTMLKYISTYIDLNKEKIGSELQDIDEILLGDFWHNQLKKMNNVETELLKKCLIVIIGDNIYPYLLNNFYQEEMVETKLKNIEKKSSLILQNNNLEYFSFFNNDAKNIVKNSENKTSYEKVLSLAIDGFKALFNSKNTININDSVIFKKIIDLSLEINDKEILKSFSYKFAEFEYESGLYNESIINYSKYITLVNGDFEESITNYFRALYYVDDFQNFKNCKNLKPKLRAEEVLEYDYIKAKFLYRHDKPKEALELLITLEHYKDDYLRCRVYSLMASVYDWFNNDKSKSKYYKKALKLVSQNLNDKRYKEIELELNKKSAFILDFKLRDTRQLLEKCYKHYYKNKNYYECSEIAHNIGTSYLFTNDIDSSEEYLNLSKEHMKKSLSKYNYMNQNSWGIYFAAKGNYEESLKVLNNIDLNTGLEEFSIYAIKGNIIMNQIKLQMCTVEDIKNIKNEVHEKIKNGKNDLDIIYRNFMILECLYHIHNNQETEAEKQFKKMKRTYKPRINSLATELIKCNVNKIIKASSDNIFVKNDLYYCEIMFWG